MGATKRGFATLGRLVKSRVNAALFAAGIVAVALPVGAQERPTLAGSWSASALGERWNIGDWGDACGPKPAPRGAAGGSVQIAESGGELTFSGGGYPRTSGCFEMGGPIAVSSHSASARFWRTRCSTSASDPRKATIVTTISATDSAISFDETGEYQFILKDQNCTASVRRNRTYSLVKRLGDDPPAASAVAPSPPPATATTPPPKPEPERAATPACDSPGEPVRVEVRPARKVMKPGETFQLKAALFDAAGCRVAQPPTWTGPDGTAVTVSSAGLVTIASDASEGEHAIAAGAFGRAAKVTIEIVSPDRYEKLLAAGGVADKDEAAVSTVTTASLGASEAVAEDTARHRRFVFLGIVGACVAALGAAGIVLLRRQKPEVEEIEELVPGETKMKVVRKKRLVAMKRDAASVRCPTCAREFPAGSVFCPNDGGRLVAASAARAPDAPPAAGAKVCPVCGVRYGANAQFCGKEGATLVPAM